MNNTPLLINDYIGRDGFKYRNEYFDADSFEHLLGEKITQCYGFAFVADAGGIGEKFLVVNNAPKPGSYTPVGGSIEPGEHPDDTLAREIQEESNMKVLSFKPIGYQRSTNLSKGGAPFFQLRYVCKVEPYGPFVSDPAGDVTEVIEVDPKDYKKYFDWGAISDHIVKRAVELKATL